MLKGLQRETVDRLWLALATLGPAGHSPKAPGTVGSLVAAAAAPLVFLPLDMPGRVAVLAAAFALGGVAASRAERSLGRKDPGMVVVDELVGQWLTFLPLADPTWWQLLVGFGLFRLFDIAKPWPVRASERWLPGGYGIMIDDVLAGLYAMGGLLLAARLV